MASETELAWAAGFFDGEGSVSIIRSRDGHKLRWYPLLQMGNRSRESVERFKQILKQGRIFRRRKDGIYMWVASSAQAENTLRAIFPYLFLKREQAEIALHARRLHMESRRTHDAVQRYGQLAILASLIRELNVVKGKRKRILGLDGKPLEGWDEKENSFANDENEKRQNYLQRKQRAYELLSISC